MTVILQKCNTGLCCWYDLQRVNVQRKEECYSSCSECLLLNSRCLAFILHAVDKLVDVVLALYTLGTLKI